MGNFKSNVEYHAKFIGAKALGVLERLSFGKLKDIFMEKRKLMDLDARYKKGLLDICKEPLNRIKDLVKLADGYQHQVPAIEESQLKELLDKIHGEIEDIKRQMQKDQDEFEASMDEERKLLRGNLDKYRQIKGYKLLGDKDKEQTIDPADTLGDSTASDRNVGGTDTPGTRTRGTGTPGTRTPGTRGTGAPVDRTGSRPQGTKDVPEPGPVPKPTPTPAGTPPKNKNNPAPGAPGDTGTPGGAPGDTPTPSGGKDDGNTRDSHMPSTEKGKELLALLKAQKAMELKLEAEREAYEAAQATIDRHERYVEEQRTLEANAKDQVQLPKDAEKLAKMQKAFAKLDDFRQILTNISEFNKSVLENQAIVDSTTARIAELEKEIAKNKEHEEFYRKLANPPKEKADDEKAKGDEKSETDAEKEGGAREEKDETSKGKTKIKKGKATDKPKGFKRIKRKDLDEPTPEEAKESADRFHRAVEAGEKELAMLREQQERASNSVDFQGNRVKEQREKMAEQLKDIAGVLDIPEGEMSEEKFAETIQNLYNEVAENHPRNMETMEAGTSFDDMRGLVEKASTIVATKQQQLADYIPSGVNPVEPDKLAEARSVVSAHSVEQSKLVDLHEAVRLASADVFPAEMRQIEAIVASWTPEAEKAAPETPAPETPAPETPAPETPAPETPASETDTKAPETPAPETPAPEEKKNELPPLPKDLDFSDPENVRAWINYMEMTNDVIFQALREHFSQNPQFAQPEHEDTQDKKGDSVSVGEE